MDIKLWFFQRVVNLLILFDLCKAARKVKEFYLRKNRGIKRVSLRGLELELYPNNNACEGEFLFFPKLFNHEELDFLKTNLKTGDVFIDAGANIGLYSLLLSDVVGDSGKVLAIEALPLNLRRLERNAELSGKKNILTSSKGVWSCKEEKTFYTCDNNRGGNSLLGGKGDTEITIECDTLYNILKENGVEKVNGLKIDIECAEYIVMEQFFKEAPESMYPEYVVVERWDDISSNNSDDPKVLLEKNGYETVNSLYLNVLFRRK
jgi:FkbM family methyltransferase